MPASNKMLRAREQAANRAAGIGDAQGRLPSRVKAAEVMLKCSNCGQEIRETKKNIEAKSHWESRHNPGFTFAQCFPTALVDPTVTPVAGAVDASATSSTTTAPVAAPKKKKEDLSFLNAALESGQYKRK